MKLSLIERLLAELALEITSAEIDDLKFQCHELNVVQKDQATSAIKLLDILRQTTTDNSRYLGALEKLFSGIEHLGRHLTTIRALTRDSAYLDVHRAYPSPVTVSDEQKFVFRKTLSQISSRMPRNKLEIMVVLSPIPRGCKGALTDGFKLFEELQLSGCITETNVELLEDFFDVLKMKEASNLLRRYTQAYLRSSPQDRSLDDGSSGSQSAPSSLKPEPSASLRTQSPASWLDSRSLTSVSKKAVSVYNMSPSYASKESTVDDETPLAKRRAGSGDYSPTRPQPSAPSLDQINDLSNPCTFESQIHSTFQTSLEEKGGNEPSGFTFGAAGSATAASLLGLVCGASPRTQHNGLQHVMPCSPSHGQRSTAAPNAQQGTSPTVGGKVSTLQRQTSTGLGKEQEQTGTCTPCLQSAHDEGQSPTPVYSNTMAERHLSTSSAVSNTDSTPPHTPYEDFANQEGSGSESGDIQRQAPPSLVGYNLVSRQIHAQESITSGGDGGGDGGQLSDVAQSAPYTVRRIRSLLSSVMDHLSSSS